MRLTASSGIEKHREKHWLRTACSLALLLCPKSAWAGDTFTLGQLEDLALSGNPALQSAARSVDGAAAAIQTARAYPDPQVEYMAGSTRYRPNVSGVSGALDSLSISQPLDLPFRRNPRIAAAKAGRDASAAAYRVFENDWIADLRRAYFDVLRRRAEKDNTQQDLSLMQSVYTKIKLRVEQGDAPRIELIRAEADLLNVQKNAQAAMLREEQALLQLRAMVGPQLPVDYTVTGQLDQPLPLPPLGGLVDKALAANPTLDQARAQSEQARHRLNYEEAGRLPTVTLRANRQVDREIRQDMIGLNLSIPLWDRRLGPVREAQAQLAQSQLALDAQTYAIRQDLEIALRQYEVAQAQVVALENGVVAQARAAVAVAETAYRAGERGLMDVLDAQRVFRSARADLIASRFELAAAWVDIQRLIAAPSQNPASSPTPANRTNP